jgi:hypothetical protein
MDELLLNHHERIVRLERSGESEKAKNAALQGAQASTAKLIEELYAMKAQIGASNAALHSGLASSGRGALTDDSATR